MIRKKNRLLERIRREAEQEARVLATEFVRAAEKEREAILAALEFEQWLAESCSEALDEPGIEK